MESEVTGVLFLMMPPPNARIIGGKPLSRRPIRFLHVDILIACGALAISGHPIFLSVFVLHRQGKSLTECFLNRNSIDAESSL